jgi:uncharacterized protein YciI
MVVVALIGHGPEWIAGKSVHEQGASVQAHLVAMRHRFNEGTLLLGGPFDRAGGIAVLDVGDRAAAERVMEADPAVIAGVMVYELFELTAYFDAFTGHGIDGADGSAISLRNPSIGCGTENR